MQKLKKGESKDGLSNFIFTLRFVIFNGPFIFYTHQALNIFLDSQKDQQSRQHVL